jgi:glycosyltransferase 2 family protein
MTRTKKQLVLRLIGMILGLLSLCFLVFAISGQWTAIRQHLSSLDLAAAFGAFVLYCLYNFSGYLVWALSFQGMEYFPGFKTCAQVYCMTLPSKYLPGNVGMFLGRTVVLTKQDVPIGTVVTSMFKEMAFAIFFGLLLTFGAGWSIVRRIFAFDFNHYVLPSSGWVVFFTLGVLALAALMFFVESVRSRLVRVYRSLKTSPKNVIFIFLVVVCQFLLLGAVAQMLLGSPSAPDGVGPSLLELSAIMTAALLSGVLVLGPPSGIGVRDGVCVLLLTQYLSQDKALFIAGFARLISIGSDLFLGVLGTLFSAKKTPGVLSHSPPKD